MKGAGRVFARALNSSGRRRERAGVAGFATRVNRVRRFPDRMFSEWDSP